MSRLLICGLATDGPAFQVIDPVSVRNLFSLFGATSTERYTITPTASTINLRYEAYQVPNNIVTTNYVGTQKNYLYQPSVSGQILTFGAIGGTGAIVDLKYTPYLGKSDLIFAARKYEQLGAEIPYVCRVAATQASGSTTGWVFRARHPGSKYNSVRVVYDGTTLTVSGLSPEFQTRTFTGNTALLPALIEKEADLGLCPIRVESHSYTLSPFNVLLSGGSDNNLSTTSLEDFLNMTNIPSDVSHILFLTELSSSMVTAVNTHFEEDTNQLRVFFIPAPAYTTTPSGFLLTTQINIPYRHALIGSVIGETIVQLDNRRVFRYATESAAFGFMLNKQSILTNVPVPAQDITPRFTGAQLAQLKLAGWMTITRYIGNDLAVYESTPLAPINSFMYSSKAAEIMARARPYLHGFIGNPIKNGRQPKIEGVLKTLLADIAFIKIEEIWVGVEEDLMQVIISAFLPSEILTIHFNVKNR